MELDRIQAAVRNFSNALSFLPAWAVSDLVFLLTVAVSLGIFEVAIRIVRRALSWRPVLVSLLDRVWGPLRLLFVTLVVALMLPAISFNAEIADWIAAVLRVVLIALLGWMALIAVDYAVAAYLMRYRLDAEDNQLARKHITQMRVFKRVISTFVILFTAAAALMTFDAVRQVGVSLFASAGVAGIVVGLAARPVLSNLIAGLQIAMTQPIRIEDQVVVEGENGRVEEITSTYVVVRLWDQRRMVVPISYFIEKPFQNWTREGSAILGSVLIYLDFTAPIDRIRAKATELVAASPSWDGKVSKVQVTDAREHTIEIRVLLSARDAGSLFDLRCEVREKLIAFVSGEFPQALPRERAGQPAREAAPAQDAARRAADSPNSTPNRTAGGQS